MIKLVNGTMRNLQALLDIQIHAPVGLGEVRVDICNAEAVYHDSDGLRANTRTNNTIKSWPQLLATNTPFGGTLSRAF